MNRKMDPFNSNNEPPIKLDEEPLGCIGCLYDHPGQLAHMNIGGCLYEPTSPPRTFIKQTYITDYFLKK